MEDKILFRKIDKFGRIVLPSKWRKKFADKHNLVMIRIEQNKLVIEPVIASDLEEFIDAFKVDVDSNAFEDYNKLKRALLGDLLGERE